MSTKEALLAVVVIVLAGLIVFAVARTLNAKQVERGDVENMRKLYLSLSLYESEADGWLPPDLLSALPYLPDDSTYLASKDPYLSGGPFPADAGLPTWRMDSPVRISFTFLYSYVTAGKAKAKPWYELKFDPKVGLLANEWSGEVQREGNFAAQVSGNLTRLQTDGALYLKVRPKMALGNADSLFFSR